MTPGGGCKALPEGVDWPLRRAKCPAHTSLRRETQGSQDQLRALPAEAPLPASGVRAQPNIRKLTLFQRRKPQPWFWDF